MQCMECCSSSTCRQNIRTKRLKRSLLTIWRKLDGLLLSLLKKNYRFLCIALSTINSWDTWKFGDVTLTTNEPRRSSISKRRLQPHSDVTMTSHVAVLQHQAGGFYALHACSIRLGAKPPNGCRLLVTLNGANVAFTVAASAAEKRDAESARSWRSIRPRGVKQNIRGQPDAFNLQPVVRDTFVLHSAQNARTDVGGPID
jgi:hypothetical protein